MLKPGGHLASFGAPRTAHHVAYGLEAAGFELRDTLLWLFAQGFPKSHNLTGRWAGWGTALKPAYEPILLARKPLAAPTQETMERYGTGALHVDSCRVPPDRTTERARPAGDADPRGRWPANLLLAHTLDCRPGACSPDCPAGLLDQHARGRCTGSQGASRFFYCAKADRRERDAGCQHLAGRTIQTFAIGAANEAANAQRPVRNVHPTVKPLALMRSLCRLLVAPGGLVLDPFCGSGSTGCGAVLEGLRFLGVEREPDYAEIARARIAHWAAQVEDGVA